MRVLALLAAFLTLAGSARANDTEAVLGAGGITFAKTGALSMESEDLRLSRGEVRVAYEFRNLTDRAIATVVAFPLPDVDAGDMSETPHTFHLSGRDGDIVDFRLTVDGRPTPATLEARAVGTTGKDVTALLARFHIPLIGVRSETEVEKALAALGPEAVKILAAAGAVYADEWGARGDVKHPGWKVRAAYHWRQTFPARAEVRIEHRYRPVLGGIPAMTPSGLTAAKLANEGVWPDEKRGWCLTPSLVQSLGRTRGGISLAWLEYVLRTGANWAGPIGHFRLEIDADPAGVVSTCPIPGLHLQRRGRSLIAERADFTPASDIAVLFLSPARAR